MSPCAFLIWWEDVFLPWSDVSAEPFPGWDGVSYHAVGFNCKSFPWMVDGVSYHASGCKCRDFPHMVDGVSYHADGCECWAFLTW